MLFLLGCILFLGLFPFRLGFCKPQKLFLVRGILFYVPGILQIRFIGFNDYTSISKLKLGNMSCEILYKTNVILASKDVCPITFFLEINLLIIWTVCSPDV